MQETLRVNHSLSDIIQTQKSFKSDSHLPKKKIVLFASYTNDAMMIFKNDEKCFLFHLKSLFRSKYI